MINYTDFYGFESSLTDLGMHSTNFESVLAAVCRLKSLQSFNLNSSPSLGRYSSSIFDECNHRLTYVFYLSLQLNNLTTVPKLGHIFPSLVYLMLYGNDLHFIESSSLAGLTSLFWLNIAGNHLTRIPFAVNKALNLHQLFVSYNQIQTVEYFDLGRLHNLTVLDLAMVIP